jgi:biotin-(acetyl-CoA carboxylase) ligase
LITIGQQVQVTHGGTGQQIRGLAEGSDKWGCLLVRDEIGVLQTIAAGDVTLR